MTRPWNPYSIDFQGNRSIGQVPTKVVVYGPALTAAQSAALNNLYVRFAARARLSVVQNLEETGYLPDGSMVRTTVINGVTTLTVYTVPLKPTAVNLFGGIVRHNGGVEQPGGNYLYNEFKENEGPGNRPPAYKDTAKLYGEPATQIELNDSFIWQAFNDKTLSGPAAKLAQFGRGAVRAYHQYFESKSLPIVARSLGAGVFILQDGSGEKKAWCYNSYQSTIYATPMEIAPLGDFPGLEPPKDITDLFGGIPIPPKVEEFEAEFSVELIPAGRVLELLGAPDPLVGVSGPGLNFTTYATTGSGTEAFFVAGYRELPIFEDPRNIMRSARFQLSFSLAGAVPVAELERVTSVGIASFSVPVSFVPPGTHVGQMGVTHVDGVLTTFTSTMVVNGEYKQSAEGGVITTTKLLTSRFIAWEGGESGRVKVAWIDELEAVSGSYSGSTAAVNLGSRTDVVSGPPPASYTYSLWQQQSSIAAQWYFEMKGQPELGQVYGLGVQGCFLVTRSILPGYISNSFQGSGSINSEVSEILISQTIDGETQTFPDLDSAPYARDYGAALVWHGDMAVEFVGPGMSLTDEQIAVGHTRFPTTVNISGPTDQNWTLALPLSWAGGTTQANLSEPRAPIEYQQDTLYADGRQIQHDALQVFRDYETDARYNTLQESEAWAYNTPLYWMRDFLGVFRARPGVVHISQLGGYQLIYNLLEFSQRNGVEQSWSLERGSLVSTPYDHAYDAGVLISFVGELQQ